MEHPGTSRAIPGAIIGFLAGLAIVLGLRSLQGLEPVWDAGVALVLAPFTMMFGWLWGVGAFNPKLSEHAEHAHDEHAISAVEEEVHHIEDDNTPMSMLMSQIWRVTTYSLLIIGIFFAIAALPTGLLLQTASDPGANPAAFDNSVNVVVPIFGTEFQTTQMIIFLAFVAFTIFSLVIFGGLIAFLIYAGSNQVAIANRMEARDANGEGNGERPGPVRALGRAAKGAARGIKEGLPKALGQK